MTKGNCHACGREAMLDKCPYAWEIHDDAEDQCCDDCSPDCAWEI